MVLTSAPLSGFIILCTLTLGCAQPKLNAEPRKTPILIAGGSDLSSLIKVNLKTLQKKPLFTPAMVARLRKIFKSEQGRVDSGVSGISGPFDGKLVLSSPKRSVLIQWKNRFAEPLVYDLTFGKKVLSGFVLSPNGKKLAYLEMTELVSAQVMPDIRGNLMIYDLDTKKPTKVGENFQFVPFESTRWSFDSKSVSAYKVYKFKDVPNNKLYNDPNYPRMKPDAPIALLKSFDIQTKLESQTTPSWASAESVDGGTYLSGESVRTETSVEVRFKQVDRRGNKIRDLKGLYSSVSDILAFWNNGDLVTEVITDDEKFGLHTKFSIIRDGKETIIHRIKDSFGDNYQSVLSSVGSE